MADDILSELEILHRQLLECASFAKAVVESHERSSYQDVPEWCYVVENQMDRAIESLERVRRLLSLDHGVSGS